MSEFPSKQRSFRRSSRCGANLALALIATAAGIASPTIANSLRAEVVNPTSAQAGTTTGPQFFASPVLPAEGSATSLVERLPPDVPAAENDLPLPTLARPAEAARQSIESDPEQFGGGISQYTVSPESAHGPLLNLKAAMLETSDLPFPISFATALQLSDARPLVVSAAQAAAWVAEAQLQRAKLIAVPELDFGVCYVRHDGYGPDLDHGVNEPAFTPGIGGPLNQNLNWMYIGGSFFAQVPLTDAIFAPLAARQMLNSRRFDIQSAKNNALLMTARTYFAVHQHRGQYAGAMDVVARGTKLVDRIGNLSRDLVPVVEVDRAQRMLADIEQHAALARQEWRVASANLTQVLRLDPRVMVEPMEHDHLQVTLIDPARPLDELMPIAITNRPELASQRAMIQGAEAVIRQEKNRPLLPNVYLTGFQSPGQMRMQGMVFGLGQGSKMNNWSLREDVSLQLIWSLEGLGLGNLARIKRARGVESQTIVTLRKMQDAVVAEVTRAQAELQSAAVRVVEAERSMREALVTFEGNYEGLGHTQRFENVLIQIYRPQEAVMALENLLTAYDQYFATVADYNRAQFELFHALGYPAREVTASHLPGETAPVDTNRPGYLPEVRPGPPPATR